MKCLHPQKLYERLIQEQEDLAKFRDERHSLAEQFRQRSDKIIQTMRKDHHTQAQRLDSERVRKTFDL